MQMDEPENPKQVFPWEETSKPFLSRWATTLASAFQPLRYAPLMVGSLRTHALRFFLLSFLPLSLLEGVIPYTHTLRFGPSFQVLITGAHSNEVILMDVLQAMGLSLGLRLIFFMALTLPYISLARAYGKPERQEAALNSMLYRAWLLPLQGLILYVLVWSSPKAPAMEFQLLMQLLSIIPIFFMLSCMRATARLACEVGPWASVAVVLVPFALWMATELLILPFLSPWIPAPMPADDGRMIL